MNRLVDAFISLPSWQGAALIIAFVAIATLACLAVARIAYRRGRRDAAFAQLAFATTRRQIESIQL